jgi:hypothetical protein
LLVPGLAGQPRRTIGSVALRIGPTRLEEVSITCDSGWVDAQQAMCH